MKGDSLNKIIASARKAHQAPFPSVAEPPFGFATRVASRWAGEKRAVRALDIYERLGWWGAGLSSAICLCALLARNDVPRDNPFDPFLGVSTTVEEPF
jgi:hypothetical protein